MAGKQKQFHDDRYDIWARLISAGTGAGKTRAGGYESWLWTWECPGSVGLIVSPTYRMLTRNIVPTLEQMLGGSIEACPAVQQYNKSENHIVWQNGSEWWLVGLDEPESAEGMNIDWCWADEFRLVGGSGPIAHSKQESAWRVLVRRLRGSVPGRYPSGIWVTTTPDAPGSVLFEHFEDTAKRIPDSRIYRWGIDENPTLSEQYRGEVRRAHGDPASGLYRRFVLGFFAEVAGGSFLFDGTKHIVDTISHEYRQIVYGVDFGWTNPAAIIAVGIDGDGRATVLEEYYQSRTPVESLIKAAKEMQQTYGYGEYVCDRSEPATIDEMSRAGLNARADDSKREEGIRDLGGRFQDAGDGRPRIYINRSCVNLISELQSYDEAVKINDHAVDALRYALCSVRGYGGSISVAHAPRALSIG